MIELVDGTTDTAAHVGIVNDVWRWWHVTPESVTHNREHLAGWKDWLALVDGVPVGVAACAEYPHHEGTATLGASVLVLERARRRGVGTALYRLISEHARRLGKTEFNAIAFEDCPAGVSFAEQRGFRCVGRNSGLRLVLAGLEPPEVELPDGVTLTTLAAEPDLAHGVWEIAAEALPDIPAGDAPYQAGSFETFEAQWLAGPRVIPEATFVALYGGDAVGYAQLTWQNEEAGIAHHEMLGVRRAFRGRGISSALKAAQIDWALAKGLSELRTENEARNAPVRALNANYPYERMPDVLVFNGPLAPAR